MTPSDPTYRPQTQAVAGSVFLLAIGFFLVRIARDALFIQEQGLFDLPRAYLGVAMLAGPLAGIVLTMMRTLGPRPTRLVLSALVSIALIVFSIYIRPGGGLLMTGFFVFVPLVWGVLYSMSWLLAGELLDRAPRHQLAESYGMIGGAAILGGLLGGLVAKFLADDLQPHQLLWLAAAAVAASGLILGWAQRRWQPQMSPPGSATQPTMAQGMVSLLRSRFGRLMLGVGMTAGLVGVLLEFQFYLAAAGRGDLSQSNTDFFANIYIILNGAALVLQILVLPRLHRWIGVGGGLMVLPVFMAGGAGALVAGVSVLGISSLRVAEGGLKGSLHRPNWEQAYLQLAGPERTTTKLLIDGLGIRIAEGLAAGLISIWLMRYATVAEVVAGGSSRILVLLFFFSLVWLLLSLALRRGISSSPDALRYDVPLPDG